MLRSKFLPLVFKQVVRHRTRSILTVASVATAMFLFASVRAMQAGVNEATQTSARDTTLVVYRLNRYCPFTSRLPEYYGERIAKIPGVVSVVPMKIVVNNCRTSLDVVTFRGVPEEQFATRFVPQMTLASGSIDEWRKRTDAALLGETLAARRGLKVGDRFDAAGVTVSVAGIARSDEPQDQNVAYVHLDFLQRATGNRKLGVVTQFNVKVDDPAKMDEIAGAIDAEFAHDPDPTQTSAEKAFVARAAADAIRIISFTSWLGWGCLAAVVALVGNAIVLSVQERIRDHAVLQTLGFNGRLIGKLVIAEGMLMGITGGLIGSVAALAVIAWGKFTVSNDGFSIRVLADPGIIVWGLVLSALLGAVAGLVPGIQASRREIAACFRAV